jgi:hypothetical protein
MKRPRESSIGGTSNNVTSAILAEINSDKEFGIEMGKDFLKFDQLYGQTSKKVKIMSNQDGTEGVTFNSLLGENDPFLNMFRTPLLNNIKPKRIHTNRQTNGYISTTRMVKRYSADIEGCSPYEIGLYYRRATNNNRSFALKLDSERITKGYSHVQIEDGELDIINVQTWNMMTAKAMYGIYKKDREAYFNITHDSIFDDWEIDGIAKHEDTFKDINSYVSPRINREDIVVQTNICHGQVQMLNYIGRNIHAGQKIWLIIKKFDAPRFYYVSQKSEGNPHEFDCGPDSNEFRPYQIAIIARYGNPSQSDLKYYDENGYVNYGKKIFLGQILFTPPGLNKNGINTIKPSTNAMEYLGLGVHDFITIILNGHRK